MQIVIDIPEDRYNLLLRQASTTLGREKIDEFGEAVLHGTPLPKELHENCDEGCGYVDERDIVNIPAVLEADKESES